MVTTHHNQRTAWFFLGFAQLLVMKATFEEWWHWLEGAKTFRLDWPPKSRISTHSKETQPKTSKMGIIFYTLQFHGFLPTWFKEHQGWCSLSATQILSSTTIRWTHRLSYSHSCSSAMGYHDRCSKIRSTSTRLSNKQKIWPIFPPQENHAMVSLISHLSVILVSLPHSNF